MQRERQREGVGKQSCDKDKRELLTEERSLFGLLACLAAVDVVFSSSGVLALGNNNAKFAQ